MQYQVQPPEPNKNPILIKTPSSIRNTCTLKIMGASKFYGKGGERGSKLKSYSTGPTGQYVSEVLWRLIKVIINT